MPDLLLSGPAGAGKSQLAAELLADFDGPVVLADFQAIYAALTGDVRGPDGRYPLRDPRLLPLVEYLRRALLRVAVERGVGIVATNSDGDPARRAELLGMLGPDATERVVDPGREVVAARLADPVTGVLSGECSRAIDRWYVRVWRVLSGGR